MMKTQLTTVEEEMMMKWMMTEGTELGMKYLEEVMVERAELL